VSIKEGSKECDEYLKQLEDTGPVWYKLQEDEVRI
jgi:hypothetical protein